MMDHTDEIGDRLRILWQMICLRGVMIAGGNQKQFEGPGYLVVLRQDFLKKV